MARQIDFTAGSIVTCTMPIGTMSTVLAWGTHDMISTGARAIVGGDIFFVIGLIKDDEIHNRYACSKYAILVNDSVKYVYAEVILRSLMLGELSVDMV